MGRKKARSERERERRQRIAGTGNFLRHEGRAIPERIGLPDRETIQNVLSHAERWLHPLEWMVGDICHDTIALEWISAAPTARRPFRTLLTAGMSVAPMLSKGRLFWSELVILLPVGWPETALERGGECHCWPFLLTADLARLPHVCDTVLWSGHTFEFEDPPGPLYPDLPFTGVVLGRTDLLPAEFGTLNLRPGKDVVFHCVFPCHEAELRFAQREGTEELFRLWREQGVSDVVDVERPSAVG